MRLDGGPVHIPPRREPVVTPEPAVRVEVARVPHELVVDGHVGEWASLADGKPGAGLHVVAAITSRGASVAARLQAMRGGLWLGLAGPR